MSCLLNYYILSSCLLINFYLHLLFLSFIFTFYLDIYPPLLPSSFIVILCLFPEMYLLSQQFTSHFYFHIFSISVFILYLLYFVFTVSLFLILYIYILLFIFSLFLLPPFIIFPAKYIFLFLKSTPFPFLFSIFAFLPLLSLKRKELEEKKLLWPLQ